MSIKTIISGGQSGVDRAALDAAINNHIVHGGWCPKGRLAEDGTIDGKYQLKETHSANHAIRTAWNVRDADATLILNSGRLEGGTGLTLRLTRSMRKPRLMIELNGAVDMRVIMKWITRHQIEILNIAGPRESKQPGIYNKAYMLLDILFKKINTETQKSRGQRT